MKQKKISSNIFTFLMVFLTMMLVSAFSVQAAQPAVNLGTAGNFAILSKSGITDVPTSTVIGNVGTTPITGAAIGLSCAEVTGTIYSVNGAGPLPCRVTNAALLNTARIGMEAAYTNAAGRTLPDQTGLGSGDISGMTLTPGLYKWTTGLLINTGTAPDTSGVTLDCQGNTSAVFIFQIGQGLTVGSGAVVTLKNGCQANNIFWQVAGQTTLGTTSVFNGNILDKTAIVLNTGAALCGRALAQTAVTLDANKVSLLCGNTIPTTAKLTVIKKVINDDGGTKKVSDFPLKVGNVSVVSGVQNTFTAGTYVVSEVSDPMYTTTFSGACSSIGAVTLLAGNVKTCTITNNDIYVNPTPGICAPKIVLNTEKVGDKTRVWANFSNEGTGVCTGGGTWPWLYLEGNRRDIIVSGTFQSSNVVPGYDSNRIYNPKTGMLDWNAGVFEPGETGWIGAYLKLKKPISIEACITAAELNWNEVCTAPQNVG